MQLTTLATAVAALAGLASAGPIVRSRQSYSTNTGDGFPTPNDAQLRQIEEIADGTLADGGAPMINSSSVPIFQIIRFNENFEVAFFSSLINNITNNVKGFEVDGSQKEEILDILTTVLKQEELHSITADKILTANHAFSPEPCTYKFPSSNIAEAIQFISTATSLVMGTLQDAQQGLAQNGDAGPVRAVSSVIGQEGEQNGAYRFLMGLKPSEKPFLTTNVGPFALSLLETFVDKCPFPFSRINVPTFAPLSVLSGNGGTDVKAASQYLQYSVDLKDVEAAKKYMGGDGNGLFITYFTGQDTPKSEKIQTVSWKGTVVTFEAFFPFEQFIMDGLSVASLTTSDGPFKSPDDVIGVTLAAPGLIEVNDHIKGVTMPQY